VEAAGCVANERIPTGGRVVGADRVAQERRTTGGRVADAGGVAKQRVTTSGRVELAGCVINERVITQEGVVVSEVAALLTSGSRLRRKRKAGEHEQCERKVNDIGFGFHLFIFVLLVYFAF